MLMAAVNHQEEPRTHTYTHAPGSEMRENQIIVIVSLGGKLFYKSASVRRCYDSETWFMDDDRVRHYAL